jgi:hypothetical protein
MTNSQRIAKSTSALGWTNSIVYVLSAVGGLALVFIGFNSGVPGLMATGVGVLLVSTLLWQVLNVFGLHVELSHQPGTD